MSASKAVVALTGTKKSHFFILKKCEILAETERFEDEY